MGRPLGCDVKRETSCGQDRHSCCILAFSSPKSNHYTTYSAMHCTFFFFFLLFSRYNHPRVGWVGVKNRWMLPRFYSTHIVDTIYLTDLGDACVWKRSKEVRAWRKCLSACSTSTPLPLQPPIADPTVSWSRYIRNPRPRSRLSQKIKGARKDFPV